MHDRLTKGDIDKMKAELEHRILEVRPAALEDVKAARALGDLSENFEYKAAKQFKNKNESRIRYLQNMIKTAIVVEDSSSDDEVGLNDSVKLLLLNTGKEVTYKIVTTIRADVLHGRISIESPMGKGLLKHRVGDEIAIKINDDLTNNVKILEIIKNDTEDEDISAF